MAQNELIPIEDTSKVHPLKEPTEIDDEKKQEIEPSTAEMQVEEGQKPHRSHDIHAFKRVLLKKLFAYVIFIALFITALFTRDLASHSTNDLNNQTNVTNHVMSQIEKITLY